MSNHKEELQFFIKEEITHFFEKVLDFAEVAIGDRNVYKSYRAKVLRLGNNAIRACSKELELNYEVVHTTPPLLNQIEQKIIKNLEDLGEPLNLSGLRIEPDSNE